MSTAESPTTTLDLPDRSTRLLVLGLLQVLFGGLCGLMGVMSAVVVLLASTAGAPGGRTMNAKAMLPSAMFYLLLGVALVWLGIGSIRARRWAWTLTVVLSWIWLVVGIVSFGALVLFMGPIMSASMEQQPQVSPQIIAAVQIVTSALMAGIYVILPAVFLLLYQRASVRATCRRRDPRIPWTDRCPMPVLALSILFACSVACMFAMGTYGWMIVVGGVFLSGAAGAAVIGLLVLVMAYLAWGTYRLQRVAWWGTLVLWIAGVLNGVTFPRNGQMEMFERMKIPPEQLDLIRKTGVIDAISQWTPWMAVVGGALFLGYLIYIRRYFVAARKGETAQV